MAKRKRTNNDLQSESKKNRQHNGQKKKDKQRSTKHTHKTKDLVTRTPLKTLTQYHRRLVLLQYTVF